MNLVWVLSTWYRNRKVNLDCVVFHVLNHISLKICREVNGLLGNTALNLGFLLSTNSSNLKQSVSSEMGKSRFLLQDLTAGFCCLEDALYSVN